MLSTDSTVLEHAYARYRAHVYAFVLSRMRNRHDAEELTQQTFVDAAATFSRGVAPRALRGWLFAVASRRVADELRRRSRRALADSPPSSTDALFEPSLHGAPQRLSVDDRRLLFLRFVEDRTHAEIAAALGCSEPA